ncbi:hypothetical protein GCM10017562_42010 [Streptomyces roseofulvus]|uniref:hypothetical protein n=1 Tax=Streptomyces roseofulvus TaxID=33902 RepID=UPI0031FBDD24
MPPLAPPQQPPRPTRSDQTAPLPQPPQVAHLPQVALVGPPGAPPALAAIRFIALLPPGWRATLTDCDETAALLRLSAPAATPPAEATAALAALLTDPALTGWRLTLPDAPAPGRTATTPADPPDGA